MIKLKPCPFCGGTASLRTRTECDPDVVKWHFVECSGCGVRTHGKFASETCPQPYEEIRDEWNICVLLSTAERECKGCDGDGCRMVIDPDEQMAVKQTCGMCNGRGVVPIGDGYSVDSCPDCSASGTVEMEAEITRHAPECNCPGCSALRTFERVYKQLCSCKVHETTGWTTWGGIPLCNVCGLVDADAALEIGQAALADKGE